MGRKSALFITLMIMSMLLTACWSERELDSIAIVTATGLDQTDDGKLRLSLLLAVPRLFGTGSAQGGGEVSLENTAGWVVSEEGETILDITRKLQKKMSREIFYSQSRVIIIGRKLAESGVLPALDFFERYRQSQLISYVAVSHTTALEILNYRPKFEKLASEVVKQEMRQNLIPSVRFIDFLNTLMSDGIEPFAPVLAIFPAQQGSESSPNIRNIGVTGLAIFEKDKMIGELNESQSRGALWINNDIRKGVISVKITDTKRPGRISAELERVKVKRYTKISDGQFRIRLKINLTENIYENTTDLNLDNAESVKEVQSMLEAAIKERIFTSCRLLQEEYNSDIFGFGQSFYRKYPAVWHRELRERWKERFPEVELNVEIKGRIIRSGLTHDVIQFGE